MIGHVARHAGVAAALTMACCAAGLSSPSVVPAATNPAAGVKASSVELARIGGGAFRGFGRSYRSYRYPRYGYHPYRYRRGRGFLHGLFWGWVLSHFFGGGFPFGWLLLLGFAWVLLRRRRRRSFGF